MADISKITLPNGSSYDIKDATARSGLAGKAAASHTHTTADQISPISISDGYTIRPFYLNTHPENSGVIVPFINNDIAFLLKRGGSAKIYYDGVEQSTNISAVFDGSASYWTMSPTGITTIAIELSLHRTFAWTNTIYIDFGHAGWRAKNINISIMNSNSATSWSNLSAVTNYNMGEAKITFDAGSNGFNKIKFTFSNWANSSDFRIACLGVLNFGSSGLRETFLPRDGGSLYGGIAPYADNAYDLGSSSRKWRNIYGNLIGNADTVDGKHASDFAAASHTHTKSQITDFPTIPTKTSQLTNDSGFKTTDNNTTYSLSKSGSTITLTGSDGKTTSVTDSDTTYTLPAATSSVLGGVKIGSNITNSSGTISLTKANVTTALGYTPPTTNTTYDVATQSANGLMSATDKTKLDNMEIVTDESVGLRKLASGTAAATTTNCPVGCWYGKYS